MNWHIKQRQRGLPLLKRLRQKFLADIRANVRSQLNNISVIEKDGSITDLGETIGKKKPIRLEDVE